MQNRDTFGKELDETIRLIHNFVAAAKSTVDITRNIVKETFPSGIFTAYESEARRRFDKEPLCQFVQQLRNYCLHRALPSVTAQCTLINTGVSHSVLILEKESLLRWSNWSEGAKVFLRGCPNEITLLPITDQYCQRIEDFREWIWNFFQKNGKVDFEHLRDLQAALAEEGKKTYPHPPG
jgi:hypothetical protein